MRWLWLLALSGCLFETDGYSEVQLVVVVDKNGFTVDRVELFGAPQYGQQQGLGPLTPELSAAGASQPNASLYSPHRSYGYTTVSDDEVNYSFPPTTHNDIGQMMIAVGWIGDQAALAGHALSGPVAGEYSGEYTRTITLAPVDVEVFGQHACVRYTDGDAYIYLLAYAPAC